MLKDPKACDLAGSEIVCINDSPGTVWKSPSSVPRYSYAAMQFIEDDTFQRRLGRWHSLFLMPAKMNR